MSSWFQFHVDDVVEEEDKKEEIFAATPPNPKRFNTSGVLSYQGTICSIRISEEEPHDPLTLPRAFSKPDPHRRIMRNTSLKVRKCPKTYPSS